MSTRFILVRHGETAATDDRWFAGSTDVGLSVGGRAQAARLADRLRGIRIDVMHVSPMQRCLQTADPITRLTGMRPEVVPGIREVDFGEWEGLTAEQTRERDPDGFRRWISEDTHVPPGGESWAQMGERVRAWWEEQADRYRDQTVLAVMHGGPILWLARHITQAPPISKIFFEIDPCSVTVIQDRRGFWRLRFTNDTVHIADPLADGPPPREVPP